MRVSIVTVCLFFLLGSCSKSLESERAPEPGELTFRVEEAPEWTALFKRYEGWFGGDGIFAIPFSGNDASPGEKDSTLFVFSDTMVGTIKDGELQPGYSMINNSVMILQGKDPLDAHADFRVNPGEDGKPKTLFVPRNATAQDDYFWLGDGFVNHADKSMYIFAYKIRNTHTDDAFPFREIGNSMIIIPEGSAYPYDGHEQVDIPFSDFENTAHTSFGAGILDNTREAGSRQADGFVYVYGVRGTNKEVVASRVKPGAIRDFSSWEFWNGKEWTAEFTACAALSDSVSNELSVSEVAPGRYALIYQYAGIFPTIYMQIGPTPVGPFGPRIKVWETTKYLEDKELFSYNAKAHPAISRPGELLISYNVNSFKFFDVIESMPNLYRPRFIRVLFEKEL